MLVPTKIQRGYKFRIDTTENPEITDHILQNGGCCRKVYNLYVAMLYEQLEKAGYAFGKLPTLHFPEVTSFKKNPEFWYLKNADSLALSNAKIAFESALTRYKKQIREGQAKAEASDKQYTPVYTKKAMRLLKNKGVQPTFRDLKGMPRFHRKKDNYYSYATNNQIITSKHKDGTIKEGTPTVRLEGNLLYVPKLSKPIKLIMHRQLPKDAKIKGVTLSMMPNGSFYASIKVEFYRDIDDHITNIVRDKDTEAIEKLSFIGLDYSQKDFYVDNHGEKANPPQSYRKSEARLARLQRQLSHMRKDSSNYKKQLARVRKLTTKTMNQRHDFCHQESRRLVNQYDVVVVEDINLRTMGETLQLGKNLHDMGFGMFRVMLDYKLREKGSFLVKVDHFYASTKTCSHCGFKNPDVKLGVTEWVCPKCGYYHDRDWNAAFNIEREGRRIFPEYVKAYLDEEQKAQAKAEKRHNARKNKKPSKKKKEDKISVSEEAEA